MRLSSPSSELLEKVLYGKPRTPLARSALVCHPDLARRRSLISVLFRCTSGSKHAFCKVEAFLHFGQLCSRVVEIVTQLIQPRIAVSYLASPHAQGSVSNQTSASVTLLE